VRLWHRLQHWLGWNPSLLVHYTDISYTDLSTPIDCLGLYCLTCGSTTFFAISAVQSSGADATGWTR
jgi:hypothetical protein